MTWSWICNICGTNGNGASYDVVWQQAQDHLNEANHDDAPNIMYSHDGPEPVQPPPVPSAVEIFNHAADAIAGASTFDEAKAAFVQLKEQLSQFSEQSA